MITKSLNTQNDMLTENGICSPKEAYKTTNDTTSGDEPNFKSPQLLQKSETKRETVNSSEE